MKKNIRLLFSFFAFLLITASFYAQEQKEDKIQVVGKASLNAIPENFVLEITINVKDSIYALCSQNLIGKLNAIQNELKSIGINEKQIKTTRFSISENYKYVNNNNVKSGYVGEVGLQVIDLYTPALLGKVIKVLKNNQSIYKLDFKLSEAQKVKLNELAVKNAIENGNKTARLIAQTTGVELVKITRITHDYSTYGYDILVEEEYVHDSFSKVENLDLSPKEIAIEKSVFIEWSIRQ